MADLSDPDPYLSARLAMVDEQLRRRGIHDERVLATMERIPRHQFIPRESWDVAYRDHPVPIGEGQTISQPYIVGAMVAHLALQTTDRVLEIGTGTGYQAAVLAQLANEVITVERQPRLAEEASRIFERLGYRNIGVAIGDGTLGVPEFAPYDAIIVAAAAPSVPPALLEQLADGGRMVIPVGSRDEQTLQLVKRIQGNFSYQHLEAVRFVPLLGEKGFLERDF